MMSWVKTRALLVLCLLGTSCFKGESAMTEDSFCEEYARIECSKVATFCSFPPADCQPIRKEACRVSATSHKTGGRQFNPGNTDACLKKLEDAYKTLPISAAMLKTVDDTCDRVFGGAAKATDPCTADFDCSGTLVCDKGHCGALKLVPSLSGCANIGERCQPDEFCSNDNPNQLFFCVKRVQQGVACSLSRPCAAGLRCQDVCIPKVENGACAIDDDCQSGYCNRYITPRTCGVGLTFSPGAPSCMAYMTVPDGGTPMRGTNEVADGGTD
jgi:hypothetical protein